MYLFIIYCLFVCLCVGVIMKTCLYKTAGPSKPPLSTTMTATVTKPVIFFFFRLLKTTRFPTKKKKTHNHSRVCT